MDALVQGRTDVLQEDPIHTVRDMTRPTGYEPPGKEKTIYAHFVAKGLQLAAIEILRIFPYQIVLHVLEKENLQQTEFLVLVSTLVSFTPHPSYSGLSLRRLFFSFFASSLKCRLLVKSVAFEVRI